MIETEKHHPSHFNHQKEKENTNNHNNNNKIPKNHSCYSSSTHQLETQSSLTCLKGQ